MYSAAENTPSSSSSSPQDQRKIFGAFMAAQQIPLQQQNNMLSFGMMMQSSPPLPFNMNKDGGAYELGELDQALFQYLDVPLQDHLAQERQNCGMRPHTLNIFPSQPMHVEPSETSSKGLADQTSMDPTNDAGSSSPAPKLVKREQEPKSPDPKTLRRLAQNREAARKSRLRKKAYVQQLETSRMRLAQLEQELQRSGSQGLYLGGNPLLSMMGNTSTTSDTALFDSEYVRWVEEHENLTMELRRAVQEQFSSENHLHLLVDSHVAHYDRLVKLKRVMVRSDVFYIFFGMWKTPAERCFLWMGGFRPSHFIKVISGQVEALTDQQVMGVYALQQSTQEAEEALSQGIEALNQSITETIASDSLAFIPPNVNAYSPQMALATSKLSTLIGFVTQADNLRLQTLGRLQHILSPRQSARCFLAIGEYFHRLRALSALWIERSQQ